MLGNATNNTVQSSETRKTARTAIARVLQATAGMLRRSTEVAVNGAVVAMSWSSQVREGIRAALRVYIHLLSKRQAGIDDDRSWMYMHSMSGYETMARTIASQCECLRARKAARSLSNLYDQLLKPSGLEISQLSVLAAVAHFGEHGAQISALADAL